MSDSLNQSPSLPREIIFVDERVHDFEQTVANLPADAAVFRLNTQSDGLAQVAAILAGYSGVHAVHIISHGTRGAMQLGSGRLDAAALQARTADLAVIGQSLAPGGDVLVYGCDVAAGRAGQDFIRRFATLSGADVAASDDVTGRGGDGVLEYTYGTLDTRPLDVRRLEPLGLTVTPNTPPYNEVKNSAAFAVIKADGSVVTWGRAGLGGDSSAVAQQYSSITSRSL